MKLVIEYLLKFKDQFQLSQKVKKIGIPDGFYDPIFNFQIDFNPDRYQLTKDSYEINDLYLQGNKTKNYGKLHGFIEKIIEKEGQQELISRFIESCMLGAFKYTSHEREISFQRYFTKFDWPNSQELYIKNLDKFLDKVLSSNFLEKEKIISIIILDYNMSEYDFECSGGKVRDIPASVSEIISLKMRCYLKKDICDINIKKYFPSAEL